MPDGPEFFRFRDGGGAIWFIDCGMTRWEKVEHPAYPDGVTPVQVPVQVLHIPKRDPTKE